MTKGQTIEKIIMALTEGEKNFGENYAQEFIEHKKALENFPPVKWHFIGHLQRNKVKSILPHVDLIHSVDSLELALEINKRAQSIAKVQSLLIEINLEEEATKTGIPKKDVYDLVSSLNSLEHISLEGFMCIPPQHGDTARPYFKALREIRDAINTKKIYKTPLTQLSMGMSDSYEEALQEGSTWIRIGTGIFGERYAKKT